MKTVDQYRQIAEDALRALDLEREPLGLYAPIRYAMDCGGKRLRPVLALAAADAVGGDLAAALPAAVAAEVFHNFTLLHDDIMDKSPTRRGKPSVYKKWNEATAILSGDAMLTYAGMILADAPQERFGFLFRTFNRAAMAVYEGQQLDMDFERRDDVTVEEYIRMISGKTSALIGGACEMGAGSVSENSTVTGAFYDYGFYLGLAFQLQDDLLDSFGDASTFGKPIGGDILNDKKTWLLITARNEDHDGSLASVYAEGLGGQDKIDRVKAVYERLGLPDRCKELIVKYTRMAVDSLDRIALPSERADFFSSLAESLVKRIS